MMITYGYSGVGKTFTLFGGKGDSGVLQNSILGIQGDTEIWMRTFRRNFISYIMGNLIERIKQI